MGALFGSGKAIIDVSEEAAKLANTAAEEPALQSSTWDMLRDPRIDDGAAELIGWNVVYDGQAIGKHRFLSWN